MPNFVITYLAPDMAAGEITAVLVVYLSGVLYSLHLWPPGPGRVRERERWREHTARRARALVRGWAG